MAEPAPRPEDPRVRAVYEPIMERIRGVLWEREGGDNPRPLHERLSDAVWAGARAYVEAERAGWPGQAAK